MPEIYQHHCHANDCHTPTPRALLMCAKHWRMVPKDMQEAVWNAYRERGRRLFTVEYYEACANAVEYVAQRENKPEENSYRRALDFHDRSRT